MNLWRWATRDKEGNRSLYRSFAVTLGLVGLAACAISITAYWQWLGFKPISTESGDWGTFGDFVGGLAGTVVGLVTLIALAITLDLQATELTATRNAVGRQQFDSTFFQMLRRFTELGSAITVYKAPQRETIHGQAAIQDLYFSMKNLYPPIPVSDSGVAIREMHSQTYSSNEALLGPYFRALYHVFKLVHGNKVLTPQEKIDYANIARAQLSRFEVAFLFYNGLSTYGEKFKPLIEEYGLLKHLNDADLSDIRHKAHSEFYKPTAFMSQEDREAFRINASNVPLERS